jgi:hypothetical protein
LELAAIIVAVVLSQGLFYAGGPQVGRYLYPLALVSVVAWGVVAHLATKVESPARSYALTAVLVVALAWPVWQGAQAARAASAQSAATNAVFQQSLAQLEHQIADSGQTTVVLQPVDAASDIEPVLSYARYLKARLGVDVMTVPAAQTSDRFSREQNRILTVWSRRGFAVLSKYEPRDECFSMVFGAVDPLCPVAVARPAL